jgi:hypothetical protein
MDADDVTGYLRWLAGVRRAIADGDPSPEVPVLPSRNLGNLKELVRRVPAVTTSAPAKDPEWQRRKESARGELDGLRERLAAEADAAIAAANPGLHDDESEDAHE